MSWLTEQCDALIEHAKHPAPQRKDPWRVTGSAPLSPCALNVLKFLWEWRENQAQELDRPPYKVMPVELMLAIARRSEANFPTVDLEKLPKLPRNFRDERLDSFVNMLQTAVAVPQSDWPERLPKAPPPPVVPNSDLLSVLKTWRDFYTVFMMMFMVVMFFAFTMIFTFAAAIMIATTAMSAATALMRKLRINNQRSKYDCANVVKHTESSVTVTFCRTMRKHRGKERIHQERVDNKAKEHGTECNRNEVGRESTLAKISKEITIYFSFFK